MSIRNLLFAGTEFAAYWSKDGGQHWIKIAGLPTIAVREIAIQKRENDLVLGTFGRGIYIVDDYSPLRAATPASLTTAATLYPVRDAVLFVPTLQYGWPGKAFQGEMLYTADNPPYGAVVHVSPEGRAQDAEAEAHRRRKGRGEGGPADPISDRRRTAGRGRGGGAGHPAHGHRRHRHAGPRDDRAGRKGDCSGSRGICARRRISCRRIARAVSWRSSSAIRWSVRIVVPGKYSVTLSQRVGGVVSQLAGPVTFNVVLDPQSRAYAGRPGRTLAVPGEAPGAQARHRRIAGAGEQHEHEARRDQEGARRHACRAAPAARSGARAAAAADRDSRGTPGRSRLGARSVPTPVAISERANTISGELNRTLGRQTATHEQQFQIASELFVAQRAALKTLVETDVPAIERELERLGAPYTPGGSRSEDEQESRRAGGPPYVPVM